MAQQESTNRNFPNPLKGLSRLLGRNRQEPPASEACILADSVPAWQGVEGLESRTFGWVRGEFPAPQPTDRYIVEFRDEQPEGASAEGKTQARILAYIDRYGRVFATDEPVTAPPARTPDLFFEYHKDGESEGVELGVVHARNKRGAVLRVASYRCDHDRYTLSESWFNFGEKATEISYDDVMARAYLAYVFRPRLGAPEVPASGMALVDEALAADDVIAALFGYVRRTREMETDPALVPPALARHLSHWLRDAGLEKMAQIALANRRLSLFEQHSIVELTRTSDYADMYRLTLLDENAGISRRTIWEVESALNRYRLLDLTFSRSGRIGEELADTNPQVLGADSLEEPSGLPGLPANPAVATNADCGRWDEFLRRSISLQTPDPARPDDAFALKLNGEWSLREAIAVGIESLRVPFHFEVEFDADIDGGVVAFDVEVPDEAMMPSRTWSESMQMWVRTDQRWRENDAIMYAEHVGVALASIAFHASCRIFRVMVTARSFNQTMPIYQVMFTPETFVVNDQHLMAGVGDPLPLFSEAGAVFDEAAAAMGPFTAIETSRTAQRRHDLPELDISMITNEQGLALGIRSALDLRISYDAVLQGEGRVLAQRISQEESAMAAVRIVRMVQESTESPLVYAACTRLMSAIAEGTIDQRNIDDVMACMTDADPYRIPVLQAHAIAAEDPERAVALLEEALSQAERSGCFSDNGETVHRAFDSYVSRLVYNLSGADEGRRVELVPSSLVVCGLDLVRMLDGSFERNAQARQMGERMVEIAPTYTTASRTLARACMLSGDMEGARKALEDGLARAWDPEQIAYSYYQLGYVLWKSGNPQAGVVCYLKSITTSSVCAAQAGIELKELMSETTDVELRLVDRDSLDAELESQGVVVSPSPQMLDRLAVALRAAVDAQLFNIARPLMEYLIRDDDDAALAHILRSLRTVD